MNVLEKNIRGSAVSSSSENGLREQNVVSEKHQIQKR